jgi:uncharacterized protein (DUF433 family)
VLEPSRVPVEHVLQRWIDGESMAELAAGLGIPHAEIEDVVRAATRRSLAA